MNSFKFGVPLLPANGNIIKMVEVNKIQDAGNMKKIDKMFLRHSRVIPLVVLIVFSFSSIENILPLECI